MTRQSVERKQNDVCEQHQRSDADAEVFSSRRWKPKSSNRVVPENHQKDDGDIKKVAMKVLEDERKTRLAAITMRMRLAHGASRRIKKERAIVSLTVVVTRGTKTERRPQNQNRGRQRPPFRLD